MTTRKIKPDYERQGKWETPDKTVWLRITTDTTQGYGGTSYMHVVLDPVILHPNEDIAYPRFNWPFVLPILDKLEIRCQVDSDLSVMRRNNGDQPSYGWRVVYKPFDVDLDNATAMQKTLARIDRVLKAECTDLGEPLTFGQYAVRAARALGVPRFITSETPPHIWRRYRYLNGDQAQHLIDREIDQWLEKIAPRTKVAEVFDYETRGTEPAPLALVG